MLSPSCLAPASIRSRTDAVLVGCAQAQRYEETLGRRLQGISTNLQPSLTRHSLDTHNDVLSALLDHARNSLLYEKQRLKEYEVLRPAMRSIRRPEAGVIYHTTPSGAPMGRSASGASSVTSAGGGVRGPLAGPPASPTPSRTFPASPLAASAPAPGSLRAGAPDPLSGRSMGGPDVGSMAQKAQKRTVRSMASSVQVEGDRRQRVDVRPPLSSSGRHSRVRLQHADAPLARSQARMAASLLANGF